jgi:hypothetical protein
MTIAVTLEPTSTITTIDGARVRVWHGTYKGQPVVAFIASIAVLDGPGSEDFARELAETQAPAGVHITVPEPPATPIDNRFV